MKDDAITDELRIALDNVHRLAFRSVRGAESAWRGYWLQALYIGARVSQRKNDGLIFLPETIKGLTVITGGGTYKECIELVQVKSCKSNAFHLSNLNPKAKDTDLEKDDSFFGHPMNFQITCYFGNDSNEAERKRTVVIHHIDAFDRSRQKRAARSALRLKFPLIRSTAGRILPI